MPTPSPGQDAAIEADTRVDVTFFVPCYNEEHNIRKVMDKLIEASRLCSVVPEILIYDDASTDGTSDVVEAYKKERPDVLIKLVRHEKNKGVFYNFVDGAFIAVGRHYRMVCGDDVEPLETHTTLLSRCGHADIIIPYYTRIEGRDRHRHAISRLYTWIVNLLTGNAIRYYNGCAIFMRTDIQRWHVEASGFGHQAEFLTRLINEGRTFEQVGVVGFDHHGGGSSVNLRNFLSVTHSLLNLFIRRVRRLMYK